MQVATSGNDDPQHLYRSLSGHSCIGGSTCVFGDTSSRKVIVLFGDSHAMMWLPAVDAAASTLRYKVVLMWSPGTCGAVALFATSYFYLGQERSIECRGWHAEAVSAIKKLHPALVLLGERTTNVVAEPGNTPISDGTWQAALERSIDQIKHDASHVALIEDLPELDASPQTCLAAYPRAVQSECAVPYPNPANAGHQPAESAAAAATGIGLISTTSWFCTATCSPVIGRYIAYYDASHVSASYARYLSRVMTAAIKPLA
jgi:hypothetical protein